MKDNRLIAEFMEFRVNSYGDYNIDKEIMGFDMIVCGIQDTKFHNDWNWLMPVVSKVLSTDEPEEGQHYFVNESLLTTDIEVVYDRVVEFIKLYNEQNRFICQSCDGHVNEVTYCEDRDVDLCNNCK
jgi:hypothetical protein